MFKRVCAKAGCTKAIDYGSKWCERHAAPEQARLVEHERSRHRHSTASPAKRVASRLYSSAAWQSMRLQQLRDEPLCRTCFARGDVVAANIVDHITRHGNDLALFSDRTNLQSLCKPCHDTKTATEDLAARRAAGVDDDGWSL